MRTYSRLFLLVVLLIVLTPRPALAYIGPGAGFALAGSFFAVFAAIFSAFFTFLTWPVRLLARSPLRLARAPSQSGEAGRDPRPRRHGSWFVREDAR